MKLDRLRAMAKENQVELIDLKFSDLLGSWHHITIPVSALKADLFSNGVGVDGSSLPGWAAIERVSGRSGSTISGASVSSGGTTMLILSR